MLLQTVTEKPLHSQVILLKPCICKVAGLLTLAFARLDIKDTIVNFSFELCAFWLQNVWNEDKTLQLDCIAKKTIRNLASTKTRIRKWVISASAIAKIFDSDNKEVKLKIIAMAWSSKKWTFVWAKQEESRRWHKEGFGKKMSALKTKTGDESLLVLKNKDKEEGRLTILTTDPVDLNYHNSSQGKPSVRIASLLKIYPPY